ncbi:hypothetical protein [Halopiger goleimassiliensis]|uniref:hypothetical protein n=1 Tax=Halopiger goleimassiliensis TaxID=1293048 RepID=UPI000A730DE2|nr:hypothetical protein [Halopiger goleimassiliensis]
MATDRERGSGDEPRGRRGDAVDSLFVLGEELRRRNASAVGVDVLYVFTTAFLATLAVRGFWPAVIAALPLATFCYFAWHSTRAFFVANVLAVAISIAVTEAGYMPL